MEPQDLLSEISRVRSLGLASFARKHLEILKPLYDSKEITDQQIEEALERAVIGEARKDVAYLIERAKNPYAHVSVDHGCSKTSLAYALANDILNEEEQSALRFEGESENIENFTERNYKPNLLSEMREVLLNPPPAPPPDNDPHPSCDCCG